MNESQNLQKQNGGLGQVTAGLIVAGIGLILLLGRMDLVADLNFHHFWPLIVITVGAVRLVSQGREERMASLIILFIGIWLLINSLGLFGLGWGYSWPLTIVAVGLARLLGAPHGADRVGGLFMIGLGALLQASVMGWVGLDFFELWPLILVLLGLWIIVHAFWKAPSDSEENSNESS